MQSRLKSERLKRNLSQARVAEIAGVDTGTVSRWECGQTTPSLEPLRMLCDFFRMSAKELGFDGDRALPQNAAFKQLAQDPISRLLALAFLPTSPYSEAHLLMRQISEEIMSNPTRREALKGALSSLVMLPISGVQQSANWDTTLQQCTVAVAACQELARSTDADDLDLAFQGASSYLDIVSAIAHDSSQLRKKALNIASRCTILKTNLGWHNAGYRKTIQYAKEAVAYSDAYYKESRDISLLLSARSKLAWSQYYYYGNKNTLALDTALGSVSLLEQQPIKVHPCVRGQTYSTLALMQANHGQNEAETALAKATEVDPGHESIAFMDFTHADIPRQVGMIRCHQDGENNPRKAREALEELIDPKTMRLKSPQSERARLEIISLLTLASLKSKDRDMDESIRFWTTGVEGAKALRSEATFSESIALYDGLKIAFPGEQRILSLRNQLVHWNNK